MNQITNIIRRLHVFCDIATAYEYRNKRVQLRELCKLVLVVTVVIVAVVVIEVVVVVVIVVIAVVVVVVIVVIVVIIVVIVRTTMIFFNCKSNERQKNSQI